MFITTKGEETWSLNSLALKSPSCCRESAPAMPSAGLSPPPPPWTPISLIRLHLRLHRPRAHVLPTFSFLSEQATVRYGPTLRFCVPWLFSALQVLAEMPKMSLLANSASLRCLLLLLRHPGHRHSILCKKVFNATEVCSIFLQEFYGPCCFKVKKYVRCTPWNMTT